MHEIKRILLVDDEAGMRDMLSWSLRDRGYALERAGNGTEALGVIERHPIDLVITDLTMPQRNGFELLAALRERESPPPVIVVTGFGTVEMAVEAMRLGAADFMLKPFDLARLFARIAELLGTGLETPASQA